MSPLILCFFFPPLIFVPSTYSALAPGVAFYTFRSLMFKMLQGLFKALWAKLKYMTAATVLRHLSPPPLRPSLTSWLVLTSFSLLLWDVTFCPGLHTPVLSGQDPPPRPCPLMTSGKTAPLVTQASSGRCNNGHSFSLAVVILCNSVWM